MPFVDLPTGATFHYEDRGTGAPFLLVHGLVGTAQLHFAEVMPWLAERYRVLGVSLRGYGESTPKPRDFPVDFYHRDADDLIAFIEALGLPPAHLLGYSDGGEVALVAAGKRPELFRSVLTIGAVGSFAPELRPVVQRTYPGDWMDAETRAVHGIDDPAVFTLGWVRAMTHMIDRGGDVSLSLAGHITCPLLLMLGDEDKLNPEWLGRKLVERTPRGRVQMFPCGHGIHQLLFDDFKVAVAAFLREVEGG